MSETTRRNLLQSTALAAGAAAFIGKQVRAQAQEPAEPAWKTLFPAGFKNERVKTSGAEINVVHGGEGPAVLFMHGAPLSLCSWSTIAAEVSKHHRMICMDLRGYGDSQKLADQPESAQMSKRPMALDGVEVMKHFGYDKFLVVGHDRGGRVARRMALDHKDKVTKLVTVDIVPAHYLYSHVTIEFVQAYPHWFTYLLRPGQAGSQENELQKQYEQAGAGGGAGKGKGGGKGGPASGLNAEYTRVRAIPGFAHAMCEDSRASAGIDLKNDAADIAKGNKIQCPVNVLWASDGPMGRIYDVLGIWKSEGVNVTGKALTGGHNLHEGNPAGVAAELINFLKA
jgi:haloacetate dehalogenase